MPKDQSIPDHLKGEELYVRVADYIAAVESGEKFNEAEMRSRLDPIFAMGAATGRRSALDELRYPDEAKDLRALVERLTRDLSQVKQDPYHLPLGLSAAQRVLREHADVARIETARCRYGFEDQLINDWLKIVDGDVPRETSTTED